MYRAGRCRCGFAHQTNIIRFTHSSIVRTLQRNLECGCRRRQHSSAAAVDVVDALLVVAAVVESAAAEVEEKPIVVLRASSPGCKRSLGIGIVGTAGIESGAEQERQTRLQLEREWQVLALTWSYRKIDPCLYRWQTSRLRRRIYHWTTAAYEMAPKLAVFEEHCGRTDANSSTDCSAEEAAAVAGEVGVKTTRQLLIPSSFQLPRWQSQGPSLEANPVDPMLLEEEC